MDLVIRLATPDDAEALVRLRAAMFVAMGQDVGPEDAPWRRAAAAWFAEHLAAGGDALAVVADVRCAGPVASALAVLVPKAPDPADPSGRSAHVSQVSTLPEHRRRGHARACLRLLLGTLDAEGIARTDLHATADGEALYRGLGFTDRPYPSLRRSSPAMEPSGAR